MNEITIKRVTKYNINRTHELFSYCDETAYGSKNLYNLANYYIRQCFICNDKEVLSDEQIKLLADINEAINGFNNKSVKNFNNSKPKKTADKLQEIEALKNEEKSAKDYKKRIKELSEQLDKLKKLEYIPAKHISRDNGLISYDFLNYYFAEHLKTEDNPYRLLPTQASQQVLRNLFKDWKSFFASIKEYKTNPGKFTGRPKLPKYKDKNGRHKISLTNQSCKVNGNELVLPKINLRLKLGIETENLKLKEVRIVPMGSIYKIELAWDKTITLKNNLDYSRYISIDLGLKNFATIVNNIGVKPIIVNGKPLAAVNQYYNKKKARIQRKLPFKTFSYFDKKGGKSVTKRIQLSYSKQMDILSRKRNNKVDDFMHKTARYIIEHCVKDRIGNYLRTIPQNPVFWTLTNFLCMKKVKNILLVAGESKGDYIRPKI